MELEELLPDKAEFTLSEKTYQLRAPTLEDQTVFKKKWGADGMKRAFETMDWEVISSMIMQLMVDKSDFKAIDLQEMNMDGEAETRRILAPERFRRAVKSVTQWGPIAGALTAAFTNADPLVKEYVQDQVKKNKVSPSDGTKSSTNSLPNTDGQQNTSSAEP